MEQCGGAVWWSGWWSSAVEKCDGAVWLSSVVEQCGGAVRWRSVMEQCG